MIKVLIADDQELIRDDIKVVGVAESGRKVLDLLKKTSPDIILMDIRMPELDGVQCTKAVKEKFPDIKIIILTTFDDDEYVFYALKYGATGYLLKGCSVQELTSAIHTVMNGGSILNQSVLTKVVKLFNQMAQTNITPELDGRNLEALNRTERNVAHLVGRGLSNKEIAEALFLSEGTIRNALSSALSKLNLRDRTQLAIWAVQTGLSLVRN